jgi:hypothetical protein
MGATLIWFILIKIVLLPFVIFWYLRRKGAQRPAPLGRRISPGPDVAGGRDRAAQDPGPR